MIIILNMKMKEEIFKAYPMDMFKIKLRKRKKNLKN